MKKTEIVNIPQDLREHLSNLAKEETNKDKGTKSYGFFKVLFFYWFGLCGLLRDFNVDAYYDHKLSHREKSAVVSQYLAFFAKYRTPASSTGATHANEYRYQRQMIWASFIVWALIVICGIACCLYWELCVALIVIGTLIYAGLLIAQYVKKSGYFYGSRPLWLNMTQDEINEMHNQLDRQQAAGGFTD